MTDPDDSPASGLPLLVGLVAVGGIVGSLARYGLVEAWPSIWTTFGINVAGSFVLGVLVATFSAEHWARPLVGTGLLGGFTTMSGLAVQTVASSFGTGVLYLVASLVVGSAAAALGLKARW